MNIGSSVTHTRSWLHLTFCNFAHTLPMASVIRQNKVKEDYLTWYLITPSTDTVYIVKRSIDAVQTTPITCSYVGHNLLVAPKNLAAYWDGSTCTRTQESIYTKSHMINDKNNRGTIQRILTNCFLFRVCACRYKTMDVWEYLRLNKTRNTKRKALWQMPSIHPSVSCQELTMMKKNVLLIWREELSFEHWNNT